MSIDIVLAWVDGSDEKWLAEKNQYSVNGGDAAVNRYRDWDLLRFWFRGVEKFMPWVDTIHFVTWGHTPSWLDLSNPKLHVVKHSDYIPSKHLPTFSSHTIELNFHNIPGLSNNFIYFNDDMFVVNKMESTDFFRNDLPVDCPIEVPLRFHKGGIDHIIANDVMVINDHFNKRDVVKKNLDKWLCLKNIYMLPVESFSSFDNPHLPLAYNKTTLNAVWDAEPTLLDETCSHKFRTDADVNQWLFRYWQFATGNFEKGKPQGKFFSIGRDDSQIKEAIESKKYKMICLSDDNVNVDFEKEKEFLISEFSKILPEKSTFEKD